MIALGRMLAAAAVAAAALAAGPGTALAQKATAVIGMQLEPPILDPTAGAAAAIDEVVYANVFEGLTRFAPDGSVTPALAKSWEISSDGLVYTFFLQEGVRFHDGAAFDAEDVVFSLDRARAPDSVNAQKPLFATIGTVEALNPETVRITLTQPTGALLWNLAWGDAVMVDPASAAGNASNPVGTGPFRFAGWTKGDRIELTRNPDYWGTPAPLEGATFRVIADPAAAFAAVMAEDVDAFPNFPAPELVAQLQADPRFTVTIGSTEGETILATNNGRAPFTDVRVRQAIAHAIDRRALIDGAMFGYGQPIGTHFAPHHPAYVDLTSVSAHDPARAKALLAEAGFPDGFEATLKLPPPSYARRGGEIVAAQLREVGIRLSIVNVEWAQWLEEVFKNRDYDLTIVAHTEPMDIGIYAREDYYFAYSSDVMKTLIAKLDATALEEERTRLLQEAQGRIAEDFVNGWLFQLPKLGVANARLKGLWENAPTQATDLTAARWE